MKYILSIILIAVLLTSCPAALCESENLQIFHPDVYIDRLNKHISDLLDAAYEGYPSENIEEVKAYLNMTFNEEADGIVFFDNAEMSVEALSVYYSGEVDQNKPSDMISLCFPKGFTSDIASLLQYAMGLICHEADPETTADDVVTWMQKGLVNGDTLNFHGAYLQMNENEEYIQYSLYPVVEE